MAINKPILDKIRELDIGDSEKKLLRELLEWQEHGTKQYAKQYENSIGEYLEKKEK